MACEDEKKLQFFYKVRIVCFVNKLKSCCIISHFEKFGISFCTSGKVVMTFQHSKNNRFFDEIPVIEGWIFSLDTLFFYLSISLEFFSHRYKKRETKIESRFFL